MEIDSMQGAAGVALVNALNRCESRGARARLDYPFRDYDKYLKHSLTCHTAEEPKIARHTVIFTRSAQVERKN